MEDEENIVDVDKIWTALGRVGKFQVRQQIILLVAIWSCSAHVMSIVFIGYRPDHECKLIETNISMTTNYSITFNYEKCGMTRIVNTSGEIITTSEDCQNGWAYSEFGEFPKKKSVVSEWDLVCDRQGLAEVSQTLVMFGQGVGAFVFTGLSDRFGRKPVHIFSHMALFFIAMATAYVPNYTGFAILRALTGAFQQGTGLAQAILSLEFFPKEIRGNVEVCGLLFWTTGVALVTPISYAFRNSSWRHLQICLACLSSWSLIEWLYSRTHDLAAVLAHVLNAIPDVAIRHNVKFMSIIDESLRWLIANGKVERARALIKKACRVNKKDYDTVVSVSGFRELEQRFDKAKDSNIKLLPKPDVTAETGKANGKPLKPGQIKTKSYTVIDLFKSKRLLMTSFILWFAWMTNSITYFGIFLISSSLAGDRFLNFFLGSIVEYPAAFMEMAMINRYGRKPAVIAFHSIAGVALIIATVLTTTSDGSSAMVLGSTVFTLIGKFAITGSFSTIFLYTPELYPTNMRNVGIGMSSCAARIGGMVAPFARNLAEVALWAPGLIFGIMCVIVSFLMLWVPETNQYELPQTIAETEQWYKDNQFKLPCIRNRDRDRTTRDVTQTRTTCSE